MSEPKRITFCFGPFRVDGKERVLLRDGQPVALTLKAFDVLLLLLENNGHIVEKDQLMDRVWAGTFVEEGNVKASVSMLRKALGDNREDNRYIETVPRRGYRFVAEVKEVANESVNLVVHERTRESLTIDEVGVAGQSISRRLPYLIAGSVLILLGIVGGVFLLRSWTRSNPRQAEVPVIKSIAVLPFKPLAADSRDESLEMGMADALIVKLSRQNKVDVRSIGAVRKYADLDQDSVTAGREQKVDAVLEGNIQKSGDTIRVSASLVSVSDGRQLWADEFNEKFTDILEVQNSISRRVAEAVAQLTVEENELLTRRDTENPEAYSLYMKGRYFWNKRTADGLNRSIDYFNQAIAKDPNYARAYAGLADAYAVLPGHTDARMSETHPKARAYAQKALEIDNQLPEPYVTLASIAADYWQWKEADRQFKQALELAPNYATAHQWYGEYLVHVGRLDPALQEFKRAQELDPTSLIISALVGQTLYLSRHFDESIAECQKTLEMDRDFVTGHWVLGMDYLQKEMLEKAKSEFEKAERLSGQATPFMALLGATHVRAGNQKAGLTVLNKLSMLLAKSRAHAEDMAIIYTGLGDKERALEWLEKAYTEHSTVVLYLSTDPFFDILRNDVRFDALIRKVNLAA